MSRKKPKHKNNIDELVRAYRASSSDRERNTIFKQLRKVYLPKLYYIMQSFDKRWYPYLQSEYDWYLLRCIDGWRDDGALFTSYWYPYVGLKLKTVVVEKYVNKSRRETVFSDLDFEDFED